MLVKILKVYIESKGIYQLLAWDLLTAFWKIVEKLNLDILLFIVFLHFSSKFQKLSGVKGISMQYC
jgi:hypothetical protein